MRIKKLLVFAVTLLTAALIFPAAVVAQDQQPVQIAISGSYTTVSTGLAVDGGARENGQAYSATVRLSPRFSGRADFGLVPSPGFNYTAGGPEFRINAGRILPTSEFFNPERFDVFAHALFGVVRQNGKPQFAQIYGGGLDMDTGKGTRWRVAQVQWVNANLTENGAPIGRNAIQLSTGFELSFNGKQFVDLFR